MQNASLPFLLRAPPHNSAARLAMSFPPSAACKFLDLHPVNLRNLHLHLTKNPFASRPPHLCGVTLTYPIINERLAAAGDFGILPLRVLALMRLNRRVSVGRHGGVGVRLSTYIAKVAISSFRDSSWRPISSFQLLLFTAVINSCLISSLGMNAVSESSLYPKW